MMNMFPAVAAGPVPPTAPPDGEAPPPYTTLPRSPSEAGGIPWTGPGSGAGAGYAPSGVRLGHVDFVPMVTHKRVFKEDEYETFDQLVVRANSWLEEHSGMQVVACETVTWHGLRTKNIYPDSCAFCKSMNADKQSKLLQGLRIWYFVEVFPDPSARNTTSVALRVKTFVPLRSERFDQLFARANDYLSSNSLGGQIISIETVKVKYPDPESAYTAAAVNPNRCFWKEYPDTTRRYVLCIRVYALLGQEFQGYEKISYQDFVPEKNQRNAENHGHEVFSDISQKVSRWVARQQGVRFTNVQTVCLKFKKKERFEERCVFIEHLCANNRSNLLKGVNRTTPYLRIARVYFVIHQGIGLIREFPSVRMTYRTFSPAQITPSTTESGPEYEGMRQLLDRINQWLQITGARVFCIETVPVRLTTGGLQLLGPEATYSPNTSGLQWTERWLYHIRVYLDGEYIEPPGAVSLVVPNVNILSHV